MNNDNYNVDQNREGIKENLYLSGSEKVTINGQEYIKFIDPKTKEISLKEINGNNVIDFINVVDILNNREDYQYKLNSLNKEQAEIYRYMIVNNKNLGLAKINIEKGIGIDIDGKVVDVSMNPLTSEISAREVEMTNEEYNNQNKELIDEQEMEKSHQKQYVYKLEDKKAGFLDMAYYPTLIIIAILIMVIIVVVGLM